MILAVDIGTSSMKGGLITDEGHLFSYHRISFPSDVIRGDQSFSTELWSQGFQEILENIGTDRITAVAISGNGPTMVAADKSGRPLTSALMWNRDYSDPEFQSSSYYLSRINWLRKEDRSAYDKADYFLSCPEILYTQLTGRSVMVIPHREYLPYVWSEDELDRLGFRKDAFPELIDMGVPVAPVSEDAYLKTPLKPGTPVIACGSDFIASLIGSGAVRPGRICDRAGTSEGINYCATAPSGDSRVRELPHALEGFTNIAAILSSTGTLFEWYRSLTGQEKNNYIETMKGVDSIPATQDHPFFFPSMKGENLWEFSNGLFTMLDPSQGKFELGRSVMEAIGFAVRRSLEIFEELDLPVKELRISGGQAKSHVWNQMKADITGKTMLIPEIEDAELLGCACLASVALGRYDSITAAVDSLVKIKHEIKPRAEYYEIYDRKYKRYREACSAVVSFYKDYPAVD
ncbi:MULTISPECIES: FGGY-family carbohydrate kinase [unclassified Oceanispirochaeta]|uniref:xylulokinase n=1 Tax=unclassified Oceanispirochaeta TaxID=2635722 RepID=UPI000E0967DC|nr:FGGY-family carbohydrate kinase [Oceanispirochaeta sp. M1]MBF9017115.1 FGGY-family carbohydrate kinase [Oceanispirochaeta sp. M2]NPD73564.1 FGGY-family carbohydrate kinase [Oceanispirochaeta sp. M1]RDG30668.1 carbohydrate kinase [Oceanispirochaeta sp. M1]